MPCCARRVVSVAPIMVKAKPEETPSASAASGAASKYGCTPSGRLERQSARSELVVIVDGERRVIGKAPPLVDRLTHRGGSDRRGGDLVVEPPADILGPGLAAIGPPRVLVGLFVQPPEDVDEADLIEHPAEPGALLGQEAGVLLVRAPVAQIDLLVRDVPVAAQDEFL